MYAERFDASYEFISHLIGFLDLVVGLQIEFTKGVFNNYGWEGNAPKGTIIKYVKDWIYIIRFQEEVWPRDREVSLLIRFNF